MILSIILNLFEQTNIPAIVKALRNSYERAFNCILKVYKIGQYYWLDCFEWFRFSPGEISLPIG